MASWRAAAAAFIGLLARNHAIHLPIIKTENEEMAKISSWFRKRGVFRLVFSHNGANATNEANQTTTVLHFFSDHLAP
jgi:hypothetical protein